MTKTALASESVPMWKLLLVSLTTTVMIFSFIGTVVYQVEPWKCPAPQRTLSGVSQAEVDHFCAKELMTPVCCPECPKCPVYPVITKSPTTPIVFHPMGGKLADFLESEDAGASSI